MDDYLYSLRVRKQNLSNDIAKAEERNKFIDKLNTQLNEYNRVISDLTEYKDYLDLLYYSAINEASEFRERRLKFLQETLTIKINQMFENEVFEAQLRFYNSRGINKVKLVLEDEVGRISTPHLGEGKFMQELIGFISSMSLLEVLGSDKFFIDEAFAAASENNKSKVPELIKEYLDKGIQMVMISQSELVYNSIPRKVVRIEKGMDKAVRIVSEVDYSD